MNRTQVKHALEQLIAGELRAEEAVRMAAEAGYRTFADMCEAELPERLPRVRIDRSLVRLRIAKAITGQLALGELRGWAEELAAVLDRHELGISVLERRRLSEALALVAVATDARIFKNARPVQRVLSAIARSLGRRRSGNVACLYGQLFYGQPEFHLLTRRLEDAGSEDPEEEGPPPSFLPQTPSFLDSLGLSDLDLDTGLDERWGERGGNEPEATSEGQPQQQQAQAPQPPKSSGMRCADVVALNRPYTAGTHVHDYEWVVAFSVATRSLVQEDSVPGAAEEGFLERARELAPNFDFGTYRPEARRDQDGVLEIVLDAPAIGRKELIYAAKLFGLVHQVGRIYFEGRRVATIAPVAGD